MALSLLPPLRSGEQSQQSTVTTTKPLLKMYFGLLAVAKSQLQIWICTLVGSKLYLLHLYVCTILRMWISAFISIIRHYDFMDFDTGNDPLL